MWLRTWTNDIGRLVAAHEYSPDRDVVSALQAWVEHGKAPTNFIATKYVDDEPGAGIRFGRPACIYPMQLRYDGSGDRRLASSFRCVVIDAESAVYR